MNIVLCEKCGSPMTFTKAERETRHSPAECAFYECISCGHVDDMDAAERQAENEGCDKFHYEKDAGDFYDPS